MIKNIFIVFLFISVIVLGTVSGVLGYLYINKNNEYSKLLSESISKSDIEDVVPVEIKDEKLSFTDTSLEVSLEYPSSWKLSADTKITDDFVYEPVYGRVVQQYELELKKGDSVMTFTKILGAVDGFPNKISPDEVDFKKVNDSIVRYKLSTEDTWKYVQTLDCEDFEDYIGEPTQPGEVCVSSFFPGFGVFANNVTVSSDDGKTLEEADQIAISALN